MVKGRPLNRSYDSKTYTGTFHWSEVCDWRFITVGGARCTSLFNIPFDTLQELGIKRVEFEPHIEVFAQRQEYTEWRGKQTKVCYSNYQIILLDFDYLFEWQSRFFVMMGWDVDLIEKFLSEDTLSYIRERTEYFRQRENERYAETLAEQLGTTKELIIQHLTKANHTEGVTSTKETEVSMKGTLKKIGNEYFIEDSSIDELHTHLYKVKRDVLLSWLEGEYPNPSSHLKTHLEQVFTFLPDTQSEPPKSRGAIGWVSKIISLEGES